MLKSLDNKIQRILADPSCPDFILADAKDADMAYGIAAPGRSPEYHAQEGRFRSLAEYRELIRGNVRQGLIDIMLMSSSNSEVLTIHERLFDNSPVTPAIRANDATDVWAAQGGSYLAEPWGAGRGGAVAAVPFGRDRRGDVRQTCLRAARASPRHRPGPVLRHVQQRPHGGPPHIDRLP
jgi:hypothetical protein